MKRGNTSVCTTSQFDVSLSLKYGADGIVSTYFSTTSIGKNPIPFGVSGTETETKKCIKEHKSCKICSTLIQCV